MMSVKYFIKRSVIWKATSVGTMYLPSLVTYLRLVSTEMMDA